MIFKNARNKINKKYKDEKHRKIARICLELGGEWATIKMGNVRLHSEFKNPKNRRRYKKECRAYIVKNYDMSDIASGFLITFALSILIKIIADWIASLIIDGLLENN